MWLCYCPSTCLLLCSGRVIEQELLTLLSAHPCSPWYRSRRISSGQTSTPTRRCPRCLYLFRRLHQNVRKYSESYIRRCWEYLRLPDAQSLERDEAEPESAGGIWRCVEGGKEILNSGMLMAFSANGLDMAIACRPGMRDLLF